MMKRIGIFGPTLCGKTTLAIKLSQQYWSKYKMRSLILDPYEDNWGEQALIFTDEKKFWAGAWATTDSLIIVDEGSSLINRDRELIPVFTKMRHNRHSLIVIGHDGTDLLPVMRRQLTTVFLFRQPKDASEIWIRNFAEEKLGETTGLQQYEFIQYESFGVPRKGRLKL